MKEKRGFKYGHNLWVIERVATLPNAISLIVLLLFVIIIEPAHSTCFLELRYCTCAHPFSTYLTLKRHKENTIHLAINSLFFNLYVFLR